MTARRELQARDTGSGGALPQTPERRTTDPLLRAREDLLKLLLEHTSAAIAMFDRDMRYLAVSRRWISDLGLPADISLIGRSHYEVFPNLPERWKEVHRRGLAGATERCEKDRLPRPDGRSDWVRWETRPWFTAAGGIGGLIVFEEVITERVEAEAALRESERRHRALVENLPGAVYRCRNDAAWTTEYVSPGIERLTGYPAAAFASGAVHMGNLIHADDREAVWQAVQDGLRRNGRFAMEYRILRADGAERWFAEHGSGVPAPDGSLEALEGFVADVTEARQAAAALRESTARVHAIVRAANVGLWDWDLRTNTVYYSPEWKSQIGYADHEISNDFSEWQDRVHPDDIGPTLAVVRAYLDRPWQDYSVEFRMRHKDGSYRWIRAQGELLRDADGQPARMLGSHLDITAHQQADEALARSEAHFREVFEQATDGILVAGADGRLLDANPSACRMFGYAAAELRRLTIADVIVPGEHERIGPEIARLGAGTDVRSEWHCRRSDGSVFVVEVNARRLPDGRLQGFLRDMTERNRIKDDLRHSARRMQALARRLVELQETAQRRMSAELHDLVGQNLTALALNLDLIGSALPPAAAPKVLPRLRDSRELLQQTVRSVRELVTELRPAVLEDYGLLAGLRAFGREYAARSGIATAVSGEEPLPRLEPPVELALYRIAQEALTNTAKHARARHVTLRLQGDGRRAALSIEDDGAGFDPEAPAEGSRTRWGLQLMQERAEAVGGRLQVTSAPRRGTQVRVEVPCAP